MTIVEGLRARIAIVVAAAALALYMVGSQRGFGYDEAASFGYAVATPNFFDALGASLHGPYSTAYVVGTNDHVLVSVIGHAIYSLTHARDEWIYRIVPAAAGAAAVGVLVFALLQRVSLLASLAGGAFMATDSMYITNVRQARGYGPAVLLCLLATLVLLDGRWTRVRTLLYVGLITMAAAANLSSLAILPVHAALVLVRDRRTLVRLLPWLALAGMLGLVVNAGPLWGDMHSDHIPGRYLQVSFVPLLPLYLLGGSVLVALGIWLTAFVLGLAWPARSPETLVAVAVTLVVVAFLAYVVQPPYLYPRFFVFLVPGCAYCIALAVQRWPLVLIPLAAVAAAVSIWDLAPTFTSAEYPIRQAAVIIENVHAAGGVACLLTPDNNTMPAYTTQYRLVMSADELPGCTVVLMPGADEPSALRSAAVALFPAHRLLPAQIPGWVLWRGGQAPEGS